MTNALDNSDSLGSFNSLAKITDKIIGESLEYEKTEMSKAQKKADEILKNCEAEANETADSIIEKGRKNAAAILSRAESNAELVKRNAVLQMKAALIDEVFRKAEEHITYMHENEFLDILMRILKHASDIQTKTKTKTGKEYEIIFNAKDREKFGGKLVEAANRQIDGSKFILSENNADIKSGFILKNGSVETNCSMKKLIERRKNSLEPQIIKILFNKI